MGPTLSVEGKKLEIVVVGVKAKGSDNTQYFYDAEAHSYMDDNQKIDLSATIENPVNIKEILDTLNAHLEESEQYLQKLKNDLADEVINNYGLPFPDQSANAQTITKEYLNHKIYVEGIAASIELVLKKIQKREVSSTE